MDPKKINITIIGSTGKIGLSLARKYLSENYSVNLSYRSQKKKSLLKKNLNFSHTNKKLKLFKFNFSSEKNINQSIKKNKNIFLKTDLLIITVAELGEISNFFSINIKKFKKTFFINFLFYVLFFRHLSSILKRKKKMLVILFSGGGSTSYRENFSSYSLTKFCLVKFTEIISYEILNKDIRFNIIAPGIINSSMTKKILNNKSKVSKYELIKLKNNLQYSKNNINKIYKTINFLNSKNGKLISGKLISSCWDNIQAMKKSKFNKLIKDDFYTLRRKDFN